MTSQTERSKSEVNILAHAFPNPRDRRTTPCVARELPEAAPQARYTLQGPQIEGFVCGRGHGGVYEMVVSAPAFIRGETHKHRGAGGRDEMQICYGPFQLASNQIATASNRGKVPLPS